MDLFCTPRDPSIPVPEALYYCKEDWDGGNLLTYPLRKGYLQLVPYNLRQVHPDLADSPVPYLEGLYSTSPEIVNPFIQTWLFFGLICEFLGLNAPSEVSIESLDEEARLQEITALHRNCIILPTTENATGMSQISGLAILTRIGQKFVTENSDLEEGYYGRGRVVHLTKCLQFSSLLLNTMKDTSIDHTVRSCIAIIGETLNVVLKRLNAGLNPPADTDTGLWYRDMVEPRGSLYTEMIRLGWCPSMIEKISSQGYAVLTMHYIIRLKLVSGNRQNHTSCTAYACKAFQIDLATYKLRHATINCPCGPPFELDENIICDILRTTGSFPVLRVKYPVGRDRLRLSVETWQPGMPYVAISHVWADGLGNPRKTSLEQCQIMKISSLIESLQETVRVQSALTKGNTEDPDKPYYFWIDTLCCPIEITHKHIALSRIAQVYRQAAHVLVLDSSLMAVRAAGCHPAELLLRILCVSPWMRRLWTLQEGALARSLWVQFADQPASCDALAAQLFRISWDEDLRYLRIWTDIASEVGLPPRPWLVQMEFNHLQLSLFCNPGFTASETSPQAFFHKLGIVQTAVNFRTVSEPLDEPLCISTVLSLEVGNILLKQGTEERMIALWKAIVQAGGGIISSAIIFHLEDTLTTRGWRWAPNSLLLSSVKDPWLGTFTRTSRFYQGSSELYQLDVARAGSPTPLGLRVTLPGCFLTPAARLEGLSLDPWDGTRSSTEVPEIGVVARDTTGQWRRIIDSYRAAKSKKWTKEELLEYDRKVSRPLRQSIQSGRCALIYRTAGSIDESTKIGCMVQIEEMSDEEMSIAGISAASSAGTQRPLKARWERAVVVTTATPSETVLFDNFETLADQLAADPTTQELNNMEIRSGALWEETRGKSMQRLKQLVQEVWKKQPEFKHIVEGYVNKANTVLEDLLWNPITLDYPHKITCTETPEQQVWVVD